MLNVRVLSGGTLVGHAELYATDPPMGVASGRLRPTSRYDSIRPDIDALIRSDSPDWGKLKLEVVTEEGVVLQAVGGVMIVDLVEDGYDELPEINVAGIDCASGQYQEWFGTDPDYLSYYGL